MFDWVSSLETISSFFLIMQHPNWIFDEEKKYMHISFQSFQLDAWNCYVCDKISKTWSTPKITEMLICFLECLHLKFWKVSVTNHALQAKSLMSLVFLIIDIYQKHWQVSYVTLSRCIDFQIYISANTILDMTYFTRFWKENIYC